LIASKTLLSSQADSTCFCARANSIVLVNKATKEVVIADMLDALNAQNTSPAVA